MKVNTYSNWCYIDQLDGEDLKHEEVLKITFPDGHSIKQKIIVETSKETTSDMGHPYDLPIKKAFVQIIFHGKKINVSLVGLEAERVKK